MKNTVRRWLPSGNLKLSRTDVPSCTTLSLQGIIMKRIASCLLLSACVLAVGLGLSFPASAGDASFARIFGTVSFQRPMKVFGQWIDVQKRNRARSIYAGSPLKLRSNETTATLLSKAGQMSGMQRLRFINTFWNRYPYVTDIKNWGKQDYWAIPSEFVARCGDCEDYAIVKYYTLLELGQPVGTMRIVVLKDTLRKLAHAVLAVEEGGSIYILDNVSNAIVSHDRLSHYVPAYSLNRDNAFVHIKGKKL
jgi:predicted transglutaminase-like cysteine proteinase